MTQDPAVIARITRAFDAAALRLAGAGTFDEQEDETSNMLHHLYRLAVEVCGDHVKGVGGWAELRHHNDDRALVPALIQMRHADVHAFLELSEPRDIFPPRITSLFGTLVWVVPATLPNERLRKGFANYQVRQLLDGKGALGTLHAARDAILAP